MKNKKRIFIRIVSIIILSSLPIIYLMNELYFFSESNKRYTIGVYCKDGFIINSSTSREKKDLFIMLITLNILQQQVNTIM